MTWDELLITIVAQAFFSPFSRLSRASWVEIHLTFNVEFMFYRKFDGGPNTPIVLLMLVFDIAAVGWIR
jgi:hypothetical protein